MNKSKRKKLLILAGILLTVCIVTFAISRYEEKKENIKNSDEVIMTISGDSVTALSWEYGDTALAFHKDGTWLWDDDAGFPVDEEKISELLAQFEEFGVSFRIEDVDDYSQYGLDKPEATICLTADGKEYVITLGAYSTLDSERYISIGDGNVYLAAHDPLEDYELTIEDMISDDEIPVLSEATKIEFEGDENYTIVYEEDSDRTYCEEDVYFTDGNPLDTDNIDSYLSTVRNLDTDTYVSYNVTAEELEAYGLDTPELTVTVTYPVDSEEEDEEPEYESLTVSVGRNREELQAAEESEEEDAENEVTAYFRVGESQIIYELSLADYNDLMAASYNDLRHTQIVTASFDDFYQLDFTLEGTTYTLTSREVEAEEDDYEEEDSIVWDYGETEDISVLGIRTALQSLSASEFTDESPTEKEELSFTLYMDNELYPEICVELYRYDGESCLARLNGETIALVSRSTVVDLIESVNAIVLGDKE